MESFNFIRGEFKSIRATERCFKANWKMVTNRIEKKKLIETGSVTRKG